VSQELAVLKKVSLSLNELGIPYMVTGSIAASFYSEPRMTRDIDLVVEIKGTDIEKLVKKFRPDFYIDEKMIKEAIQHESLFNIIHNETMVKVDFVVRKDSEYRKVEFGRRRTIAIDGVSVGLVTAEDLVLSKLLWAKDSQSEFQMRDVSNILRTQKNLDMIYIKRWSETLGIAELLNKVSTKC
jgi:hypothetical protein